MADDVVKRLVTQLVIEAGDAFTKGKQFTELVNQIRGELKSLMDQGLSKKAAWEGLFSQEFLQRIKETKKTIADLKQELKDMKSGAVAISGPGEITATQAELERQKQTLIQLRQEATQYSKAGSVAMRELGTTTKQTTESFAGLGNISKYVFGTILGVTAVGAIQRVIQYLTQAAQAGFDFAKAIFQLEIGIRALRRAGMDVTLQEMYQNIDKLRQKFGVFAFVDMAKGSAELANLTRDLKLTKDQFFKLQDAVATLAVVNGRSMDEVQRTVALALSSGYTEGLQRLGVSINRVTIAEQAATMGWKNGYTALTEYQRSQATYVLILDKILKYENDLAKYRESLPGQIEANTAALKDYDAVTGVLLLTTQKLISELKVSFAKILLNLATIIGGVSIVVGNLANMLNILTMNMEKGADRAKLLKDAFMVAADQAAKYLNFLTILYSKNAKIEDILKAAGEYAIPGFEGIDVGAVEDATGKLSQEVSDILESMTGEFDDILKDHARRLEELQRDFDNDIARIERELARDLEKAERDSLQKRSDIWQKYYDDISKANKDYAQKVADAEYDYAKRRTEIEAKYREDELQAEIKFQEAMRKLREGFVLDLEDALRERDALQILRLIRRYNLEKKQEKRQYEIDKSERKRQFESELEELKEQRRRKLEVLAREYKDRIEAIYATLTRELQAERDAYKAKIEELRRQAQVDKDERAIRYQEQTDELKILLDQRLKDLADKYVKEENLTREHVNKIIEEFSRAYGPGGEVEKLYKYLMQMVGTAMAASAMLGTVIPGTAPYVPTTPPASIPSNPPTGGGPNQNKSIIPMPTSPTTPSGGKSLGNGSGQLAIELFLSPDLQARIINNTLNEVANVLVNVQKRA